MVQYETPDDSNIKELHMHLTNTSLNSKFTEDSSSDESSESSDGGSDDDEDDDDEPAACKQYLGIVMDQLKSMGVDTKALWNDIMRIVSHTMSAIQPELAIAYTSAFMKPENAVSMAKRGQKKKGPQVASLAQRVISNTLDFTRCFQIIGFDILLDKNCKPYIIEINHNPSFKLPTPIDVDIKVAAMTGCLGIVTDRSAAHPLPYILPLFTLF
jgi:tubulin polyglutamylase TTLL6/13